MKKIYYFYEGETEKTFLTTLKGSYILSGRLSKFNLWQDSINKIKRKFNTLDELFFIIDTDTLPKTKGFIDNLRHLSDYNFHLVVQNKNLEDELVASCNKKSKNDLYQKFYSKTSKTEFKSSFIKDNNLKGKLERNNFNYELLWSRTNDFSKFLMSNGFKNDLILKPVKSG